MTLRLEPLPAEEYADWRAGYLTRRAQGPRNRGLAPDDALEHVTSMLAERFPPDAPGETAEVLAVTADGERVGVLVLSWANPTQAQVGDLQLPASSAAEVRDLVVARARSAGAVSLAITIEPGDPVAAAFTAGQPWDLVATQMQLDLAATPTADRSDRVVLRPMTSAEVEDYLARGVEEFAAETMAADPLLSREDALAESRRIHEQILPQGAETPDHDFLAADDVDDGHSVGFTWLFRDDRSAFVYDVIVAEAERGRGYGRALMDAAAGLCRSRGAEVLGLNVFGHNEVAHGLYDSLGYAVVDQAWQVSLATVEG